MCLRDPNTYGTRPNGQVRRSAARKPARTLGTVWRLRIETSFNGVLITSFPAVILHNRKFISLLKLCDGQTQL